MQNNWIEWIFFADEDMKVAKTLMQVDGSPGQVGVSCQQAIEKYFKAHLIKHGWDLRKTHNLLHLYGEIERVHSWNLDKDLLAEVNSVYTGERYPADFGRMPDGMMPTRERAQSYLELAEEVEDVFKKTYITTVDDIKEIIRTNYGFELTPEAVKAVENSINDDKLEVYQAYNKAIEEIDNNRRKARIK